VFVTPHRLLITNQERRLDGNSVANTSVRFNRRGQFYPTPERLYTPWYYRLCKGRLEGAESSSWVRQRPEEEREEERDKKWNESLRRSTRVYTFLFPRLKTELRNRTTSQPHYAPYLTSTETDSASAAESSGLHRPERIKDRRKTFDYRSNLCHSKWLLLLVGYTIKWDELNRKRNDKRTILRNTLII